MEDSPREDEVSPLPGGYARTAAHEAQHVERALLEYARREARLKQKRRALRKQLRTIEHDLRETRRFLRAVAADGSTKGPR